MGDVTLLIEVMETDESLRPIDSFKCALAAATHGRVDVVSALVGLGAPLRG